MTDKTTTTISLLDQPADAGQTTGGRVSSVAEFVAEAIAEQRRNDGLSQLLAGIAAAGGEPTEAHHEWARATLGVS